MNKQNLLTGTRIFFALLGFSAVVTEIAVLNERGRFISANFFSYFTVESNLFAVIILMLSAMVASHHRQNERIVLLRGSSTLNMIVVGIIFSLLLAGLGGELTAVPWDNTVLHYIMPVFIAFDWIIDPPKLRIPFKRALMWMVLPIVYVMYSLIRGYLISWYPYPFFNPSEHGYFGVAIVCLAIVLFAIGLIWVLTRFTGRQKLD